MKKALLSLVLVSLLAAVAGASDKPQANLKFVVLKAHNGKPVRNASVVLHLVDKKGKQARGGYQLKTDAEGKTSFDGAPYGKLRVQVLTPGFQTFGEDYDIDQPEVEFVIKLKKPQEQVTIYK
ncbi:MAG: carboxypeptidase-like regulatory domain-containing protein [Acidobacteriota bacterium]|nr:carboxypeptidase-like regulatory domain-containing protein [Acidobacteriota bacterium]